MSEIRVDTFKAEDGISAPSFPNGITVTGVVTASSLQTNVASLNVGSNINLGNAGIITATSYRGDGSQLTGISVGLSTNAQTVTNGNNVLLDLSLSIIS